MEIYNKKNHNEYGNPHQQYDNNPYRFQYITPDVSSSVGKTYGYNKILEFICSGHLYNLPENMRYNVSKHLFLKFRIKDINTQGAIFDSEVELDVLVNENSKTKPFIRANHFFQNLNNSRDILDRKLVIKQTIYPEFVDSDGVYPVKIEVFVSAPTYGKVSIIPVDLINQVYTPDSVAPNGPVSSKFSTTKQKFNALIGEFESQLPISEDNLMNISDSNQTIFTISAQTNKTVSYIPDGVTSIKNLCDIFISNIGNLPIAEEYIAINQTMSDCPLTDAYSMIKLTSRGGGRTYIEVTDISGNTAKSSYSNGVISAWFIVANYNKVVPNYGNKTINGDTTMVSGNYGISITTNGIKKTIDGGSTWTNI